MIGIALAVMLSFRMVEAPSTKIILHQHQYADGTAARTYVCPKDETLLRVKAPQPGAEYKCPVDGTVMEAGKGPEWKYFLLDEKR